MKKHTSKPVTLATFSKANLQRCESSAGFNHKAHDWTAAEWLSACVGEMGEIAHVVKNILRLRDGLNTKPDTEAELVEKLGEEIADTIIYLDMLAHSQNLDLEEIIVKKFNSKSKEIESDVLL